MKFKGITRRSKQTRVSSSKQEEPKSSKKKVSKKETKKPQLPKIYRNITEPRVWIAVVTAIFLLCLLAIVFLVYGQVVELKKTLEARHEATNTLYKWENIIAKYPNFRDGYVGAGELEYQLGDYNKAMIYIQKALELDPNYAPSRKLESILRGKQ